MNGDERGRTERALDVQILHKGSRALSRWVGTFLRTAPDAALEPAALDDLSTEILRSQDQLSTFPYDLRPAKLAELLAETRARREAARAALLERLELGYLGRVHAGDRAVDLPIGALAADDVSLGAQRLARLEWESLESEPIAPPAPDLRPAARRTARLIAHSFLDAESITALAEALAQALARGGVALSAPLGDDASTLRREGRRTLRRAPADRSPVVARIDARLARPPQGGGRAEPSPAEMRLEALLGAQDLSTRARGEVILELEAIAALDRTASRAEPTGCPGPILGWTPPRCKSTLFQRALEQLSELEILHEPYGEPYYFGPERSSSRYDSSTIDPIHTFENITRMLEAGHPSKILFSKDMAYYRDEALARAAFGGVGHNLSNAELSRLLVRAINTFLVREPRAAIASLHRLSTDTALTGWTYFDAAEAGFRQTFELYAWVTQDLGLTATVLDTDALCDRPREHLEAYTEATGVLEYRDVMLSWPAVDRLPHWEKWRPWHLDVMKSEGFRPTTRGFVAVPPGTELLVERCRNFYEGLTKAALPGGRGS